MANRILYLAGFFLVLVLFACNKDSAPDCFKQTGAETTIVRYPHTFDTLILLTDIDVELIHSPETKIEITGGKNLLKKISTNVERKTLEIDNLNNCGFVRGYKRKIKIKVYAPGFSLVRNNGVGNITIDEQYVINRLEVRTESVGDIYANGTYTELVASSGAYGDIYVNANCDRFFAYIVGTNYLHAENLKSKYVEVNTDCLGDCFVNVASADLFKYTIKNSGNIYYYGVALNQVDLSDGRAKGKAIRK